MPDSWQDYDSRPPIAQEGSERFRAICPCGPEDSGGEGSEGQEGANTHTELPPPPTWQPTLYAGTKVGKGEACSRAMAGPPVREPVRKQAPPLAQAMRPAYLSDLKGIYIGEATRRDL